MPEQFILLLVAPVVHQSAYNILSLPECQSCICLLSFLHIFLVNFLIILILFSSLTEFLPHVHFSRLGLATLSCVCCIIILKHGFHTSSVQA